MASQLFSTEKNKQKKKKTFYTSKTLCQGCHTNTEVLLVFEGRKKKCLARNKL